MNHQGTKPLETERLLLRRMTLADVDAMYAHWASDAEVTRYLTWQTHSSPAVTADYLRWVVDSYQHPAFYQWGIEWKENRQLIGNIAVVDCQENIDALELGWALGRAWWGRGIMPEAARAILRYLFEEVGANRIFAGHDTNNPKSGRVMEKIGMVCEGTHRGAGRNNQGIVDVKIYAMLRADWQG